MNDSSEQIILQLADVGFEYRPGQRLLQGLDLKVFAGQFIAILGANGAGKSTMLRLLAGMLSPNVGAVSFLGRRLDVYNRRQLSRHIAFLPQQPVVSFDYTALQVVLMGRFPHHTLLGLDDQEDFDRASQLMAALDVAQFAGRRLSQLSGGECQRVLLASALAQYQTGSTNAVLLLDEPTAALDLKHQVGIFALLGQLNRQFALTVVVVTHDLNLASMFCPQLVLLADGKLIARGDARAVLTAPNVQRAYGLSVKIHADAASGRPYVLPEHAEAPAFGDYSKDKSHGSDEQ